MSLPKEKKEKLADNFAKDIIKEMNRHYQDLRNHEVSPNDTKDILRKGFFKAKDAPFPKEEGQQWTRNT